MTLFWIFCAALLLLAMLFVVWPLWKKSGNNNEVLRDAANLGILRDQSTELEVDLKNGLFTQEAYEQGKRELQGRLIDEVKTTELSAVPPLRNPAKILAIVMMVLLPLFTVLLYLEVGTPKALRPGATTASTEIDDSPITSEEGLRDLQSELNSNPDNPHGWYKLASSYIQMKRYTEAANAYEQLVKQVPDEAQLWSNYADVFAMAHGKSLQSAEVKKFLATALDIDPNNMTALALSGSAAMQGKDYVTAITLWQQMLSQLEPDSAEAQQFTNSIQEARDLLAAEPGGKQKLAQLPAAESAPKSAVVNAAAVSGTVTLSQGLAAQVKPDDVVFVLARAAQGPKMPLAVLKKQVKDLPLQFSLDDSMAMQPQLKLSGFDNVIVVARVSKSGSPMAQSGDLEGLTDAVKPGAKGLSIVIGTVVP
ncbi:MAG: c-type cytochrome biogenesis protein CcmI [Gallionella sp.]|nr:c-type cytochrome biogenesis protein CcmI [Gallionella sp.]